MQALLRTQGVEVQPFGLVPLLTSIHFGQATFLFQNRQMLQRAPFQMDTAIASRMNGGTTVGWIPDGSLCKDSNLPTQFANSLLKISEIPTDLSMNFLTYM